MSSRRGTNNPISAGGSPSPKGKNIQGSSGDSSVNQLNQNMAGLSLSTAQNDGDWEVFTKKPKGRTGAAKPWGPPSSTPKAWGPDTMQKLGTPSNGGPGRAPGGARHTQAVGRGNVMPSVPMAPRPVVPHPIPGGWNWAGRAGSPQPQVGGLQGRGNGGTQYPQGYARQDFVSDVGDPHDQDDIDDDDDDGVLAEDTDDDILSDGFDSDESVKSHGTRKKNNWFKAFFEAVDNLSVDQLNEPSRQWHCPACANGPGAINWYRGLQPLMAHAKTKGSKRVRLHREFAELLDEELIQRGTSVIPAGEAFGKWEGLRQPVVDHEIVWPPMVIVMNTKLEQDDKDKWIGMGNQELLDYFDQYKAVKARHSYGPQGHRGMSVLIFESAAMGYTEAERLHKHFANQRTDRDAWNHRPQLFKPGGTRQLYGYLAKKEDLDSFNQHSQGKARLKFEMRSYQEMVVQPLKQMEEDSQTVTYLNNQLAKEKKEKKLYERSLGEVSRKLRQTKEENIVVRKRTKEMHEQNKEEMDFQEEFFLDQISKMHQTLEEKERAFAELHQAKREKMKESSADSSSTEGNKLRVEEITKFMQSQDKGIKEFEAEREEAVKLYEERKAEMKKKHLEEQVVLEKYFTDCIASLIDKYAPQYEEVSSSE